MPLIPGKNTPDPGNTKHAPAANQGGGVIPDYSLFTIYTMEGGTVRLTYYQLKQLGWVGPGRTLSQGPMVQRMAQNRYEENFHAGTLPAMFGGGGSGGGSGSGRGEYVAPNKDVVREQIKAYVVATTGTVSNQVIDAAVAKYMEASKRAFDLAGKQDINPYFEAQSVVRDSAAYKSVNALRPESIDEMEWVTQRQAKLQQLGLSGRRSEALGISQSIVGSNDEALVGAAEISFAQDTGRLLQHQREKLKQSASAVLGLM